jgi:hypothetical protein
MAKAVSISNQVPAVTVPTTVISDTKITVKIIIMIRMYPAINRIMNHRFPILKNILHARKNRNP